MDLDGLQRRLGRHLRAEELGVVGLERVGLAGVLEPGGLEVHVAGQLDVHGDVGQLELDGLELADGLAELHALLGVLERGVEAGLGDAHPHGADGDAPAVEHLEELLEALAPLADQVLLGHPHVVEEELGGVGAVQAHLLEARPHREARRAGGHDDGADARACPCPCRSPP